MFIKCLLCAKHLTRGFALVVHLILRQKDGTSLWRDLGLREAWLSSTRSLQTAEEPCNLRLFFSLSLFILFNFLFCIGVQPINSVVIVYDGQQRDSSIRYPCIHRPPNSLPSRLPHNTKQGSLCDTVGPCWIPILNIAACICILSKTEGLALCLCKKREPSGQTGLPDKGMGHSAAPAPSLASFSIKHRRKEYIFHATYLWVWVWNYVHFLHCCLSLSDYGSPVLITRPFPLSSFFLDCVLMFLGCHLT